MMGADFLNDAGTRVWVPLSVCARTMKSLKITCPGEAHRDREKILVAARMSGNRIVDLACYCQGCNRWYLLRISPNGAVRLTQMPKKYHFDFETLPTLVIDHGN